MPPLPSARSAPPTRSVLLKAPELGAAGDSRVAPRASILGGRDRSIHRRETLHVQGGQWGERVERADCLAALERLSADTALLVRQNAVIDTPKRPPVVEAYQAMIEVNQTER